MTRPVRSKASRALETAQAELTFAASAPGQARRFTALSTVCTHLGCTPNWLPGEFKFKCPCHGSGYRVSGLNFEGPAPRPLEHFAISLDDTGMIKVDKSRAIRYANQWADPDFLLKV